MANFAPDVGFAWWLMENFWVQFAKVGRGLGLHPIIAYPTDGDVPQAIRNANIETLTHPLAGSGITGFVASLKLIRARRVRCMYLTDHSFTSLRYLFFRLAGVRVIINHDHVPGERPPSHGVRATLKAAWRLLPWMSCDLQIAVSPLIRERAVRSARIPARKTVVVQNGIEPIECPDDPEYVRREFGLPDPSLVCVTVGRAHPNKRIDFVIEVARHCIVELQVGDLFFLHCGDGPEMERLRSLVEERALDGRFLFAGRRSDVDEVLCSSDVALHAARGEAFSLAILEYMSAGLPALVPDLPTVSQAIRHGETGVVYPDGDAAEAARLLSALCNDPARRARLGAAASAEVRERYTLRQMNESFRGVVEGVLEGVAGSQT